MRKTVFLMVLILSVGLPVFSAEEDKESVYEVEATVGIAGSIASSYITPDISFLYSPGVFSFGGGVKTYFGTELNDIYLAPYGRVDIGWLYVKLGFAPQLKEVEYDGNIAKPSSDYVPMFFSVGVYPKIKLGPGRLVFGTNMDILATTLPVIEGENPFETFVLTAFGAGINMIKLEAGVGYRLAL